MSEWVIYYYTGSRFNPRNFKVIIADNHIQALDRAKQQGVAVGRIYALERRSSRFDHPYRSRTFTYDGIAFSSLPGGANYGLRR